VISGRFIQLSGKIDLKRLIKGVRKIYNTYKDVDKLCGSELYALHCRVTIVVKGNFMTGEETNQAQVETILAMMSSGHRCIRMERHSLIL
jgi:hypothetical protein